SAVVDAPEGDADALGQLEAGLDDVVVVGELLRFGHLPATTVDVHFGDQHFQAQIGEALQVCRDVRTAGLVVWGSDVHLKPDAVDRYSAFDHAFDHFVNEVRLFVERVDAVVVVIELG